MDWISYYIVLLVSASFILLLILILAVFVESLVFGAGYAWFNYYLLRPYNDNKWRLLYRLVRRYPKYVYRRLFGDLAFIKKVASDGWVWCPYFNLHRTDNGTVILPTGSTVLKKEESIDKIEGWY